MLPLLLCRRRSPERINTKITRLTEKIKKAHSIANQLNQSLGKVLALDKQRTYKESIQQKIIELSKELSALPNRVDNSRRFPKTLQLKSRKR